MKNISLTIDGRKITANPGMSVFEAARQHKIHIPALCHDPRLEPYGACRLCIVQIEGIRGLPTSCTTPVRQGMIVTTETAEIQRVRRGIIELALSNHPSDCLTCRKSDECELLRLARYLGVTADSLSRLRRPSMAHAIDTSNPAFDFEPDKCILCGRCIRTCNELVGLGAIAFSNRGIHTRVSTFGGRSWIDSSCQSCGECVEHCPTGALTPKDSTVPQHEIKTLCPFCGVGCSIRLGIRANRIVRVRGDQDSPVNQGELCVKGRFGLDFVNHPDRLRQPLIRRENQPRSYQSVKDIPLSELFRPADWDEALDLTALRLGQIMNQHGPDAIGVLSSAKCTNEENYLLQKFARAVLHTNNVDHCARLCHASTVTAALAAFGEGAMSNSIADLAQAGSILIIGSNTAECHPVIARRIKQNVMKTGASLIVADPRATELTRLAACHLAHRPGSDVALLNGLMHWIIKSGLHDRRFIKQRCEDFENFSESLEEWTPEKSARMTGVAEADIKKAAEIFARSRSGIVVYGMGITQHTTGVDNVKAVANLLLLTGNMGREGTGFSPLRGQNNVQGACDMGALPNVYPGYQRVDDQKVRAKFSAAWNVELSDRIGLALTEMISHAGTGDLQAMYVMGENPLMSEPDLGHARKALENLHFLVVQDIFPTETALLADVILPGTCFAEKDGSFTNTERRVQRLRKALPPPGRARSDWQIVADLATRLGYPMKYTGNAAILQEIANLTPIYGGITAKRLNRAGGLQWPCPNSTHPGTERLHEKIFSRGKGKFHVVSHRLPAEVPSKTFPMVLTTGRILEQYHTGSMSRRSRVLETLEPGGHIDINPQDAKTMGVQENDLLKVTSARGTVEVKAQTDRRVPPGLAFMAFHWREAPANILTNRAVDPAAKIPEFKVSAIKIEKTGS